MDEIFIAICRLCREISFQFRTKLPHGLLVYHSVKDRPESLEPYALYVIVEKGQLKVVHVFGKRSTSLTVGEGLNRDEWHSVLVRIDVHGAKLIARVDDTQEETTVEVLERVVNYGVSDELASVVLIGGEILKNVDPSNDLQISCHDKIFLAYLFILQFKSYELLENRNAY